MIRTRKFLKRGWHINAGQYLKMCFQISELDLSDITGIIKRFHISIQSELECLWFFLESQFNSSYKFHTHIQYGEWCGSSLRKLKKWKYFLRTRGYGNFFPSIKERGVSLLFNYEKQAKDPNFAIYSPYIVSVIDKIFG